MNYKSHTHFHLCSHILIAAYHFVVLRADLYSDLLSVYTSLNYENQRTDRALEIMDLFLMKIIQLHAIFLLHVMTIRAYVVTLTLV